MPVTGGFPGRHERLAALAGLFIMSLVLALAARPADSHAAECTRLLVSGNPEYPPYLWRDPAAPDRLIGANAELMALLSEKIGMPVEVRYTGSWARVQEEMRAGRIDLIAGAFLTTPRLGYMDYFIPLIARTRSVVITPEGSDLNYRQWPDLVGHAGVTVINNSFGEAFDRYAKENLDLQEVGKLENALQMVAGGRAEFVIYEDAPARAFAARAGITGLVEAPDAISNENLYLTFSHRSPCNTGEMRGRIAQAMQELTGSEVMGKLIEQAIESWRSQ
ncbi:amino acid ABC transporter substrate-binding protein (PAAT family) [Dongia mobilis]|uniref:Amino acid ABC transporter substrate-binding protein (PAAT family) n=2 Tax=Dongia mobilis TaxID=578943 RepID=A0A4R6WPT4_9PROT|nr:amino acid ABC transporter substrate-binding protein (PAAT family) [Dongia mobilis]